LAISEYLTGLRAKVGNDLLLLPSVAAIVFDADRRMLLVQHAEDGLWVAPGGGIDPGETPADAVVREMYEETGLLAEPVDLIGVYSGPDCRVTYANGHQVLYVMSLFECRVTGGALRPDEQEIAAARYVAAAELPSLPLTRWAAKVLPELFRRQGRAYFSPPVWTPARP
jgi:8-oxo-dGTP pyrophosphatase MutT (NUDIX family)